MNFFKSGFFKNKKVLITGNTGFKGSWLTQVLLMTGVKIFGFALKPNTNPSLFEILKQEDEIEQIYGDIRNFAQVNESVKKFKPDIIFHLAAQPIVRLSYDNPLYTYETNTLGTANILEAIRVNQVRAGVVITTDKVYKNTENSTYFKEEDALGGFDPYSSSKSCADLITESYLKSFFNVNDYGKKHFTLICSARAGNVIGGGDWAKDRLVPDLIRAFFTENKKLTSRNPKSIRPWQFVLEPLSGYIALAEKLYQGDISKSGAWNFGPEKKDIIPVEQIIKIFIRKLKKGEYIIEENAIKHEDKVLRLDISKAKKELGWKPKYDIKQAVEETAVWYETYYRQKRKIKTITTDQIKKYFEE